MICIAALRILWLELLVVNMIMMMVMILIMTMMMMMMIQDDASVT